MTITAMEMQRRAGRVVSHERVVFLAVVLLAAQVAQAAPYDYSASSSVGPSNWGQFSANGTSWVACRTGTAQSPIDLTPTLDTSLSPIDVKAGAAQQAVTTTVSIRNDGAQLEVYFDTVGGLKMSVVDPRDGRRYFLWRIQFHATAEHGIFNGRPDGEMQLHYSASAAGGVTSRNLVVSVFLRAGIAGRSAALDALFDFTANNLPAAPTTTWGVASVNFVPSAAFRVADLVPPVRDYIVYDGSLTQPPCTEGFRYYLFTEPLDVAYYQLAAVKAAVRFNSATSVGNNRPLQAAGSARRVSWFVDRGNLPDLQFQSISASLISSTASSALANVQSTVTTQMSIAALVLSVLAVLLTVCVPRNLGSLPSATPAAAAATPAGGSPALPAATSAAAADTSTSASPAKKYKA